MNVYNGVITTTMQRKIILHAWMIILHGWCYGYLHKTSAYVWHSYHKRVFIAPNFFLLTHIHNDEDEDDNIMVVVIFAPNFFC